MPLAAPPLHTVFAKLSRRPRIGLTPCIFHPDPERAIFKGKALFYYEHMMIAWIQELGIQPYLIPPAGPTPGASLDDFCAELDGVVFQGGVDVAPESYRESPLKAEWGGDRKRDEVELEIARICDSHHIPMLGICRGAQILAVHAGGTLYQDIQTQIPGAFEHRNWDLYEDNKHTIRIQPGTFLSRIYPDCERGEINSIHHQSIKTLPEEYEVGAVSETDGVIEAFARKKGNPLVALQWHPEFQRTKEDQELLPRDAILRHFADTVSCKILAGKDS